jgi:hypothetical protein
MKRALIRYRIKPGQALHNGELVRAVYSELERTKPIGLRYATLRHRDGGSLVHIVENDTPDGPSPLDAVSAFARFTERIEDRCDTATALFTPQALTELIWVRWRAPGSALAHRPVHDHSADIRRSTT